MSSEQPNPTIINQIAQLPEGAASNYMGRVITEVSEAKNLKPEVARNVLVDHLIGTTLRVMGAEHGLGALYAMGNERPKVGLAAPGNVGQDHWIAGFTRKEGLRRAVIDVEQNPPSGNALNGAAQRLRIERTGAVQRPVFTTMDQIDGYLDTEVEAERRLPHTEKAGPWKSVIKRELADYLENPNLVKGRWDLGDHATPEAAAVMRDARNAWSAAAETAKKAGIDIDLLTKSVEWMKAHENDPVQTASIGKTALIGVRPDYSHLLY